MAHRATRVLVALLLVTPWPLVPATITVQGACTLQDAIHAANTDAVAGGCTAGSGTDQIELTGNVNLTAVDNNDINGLPLVESAIGLDGHGFTIRRHPSAPEFRLFQVQTAGSLRLENVILKSGSVSESGGAIKNRGVLELESVEISESYAVMGGAVSSDGGSTTIVDSTISNNYAIGYGGGVYMSAFGEVTITDSTISGNYSGWSGGGIFGYGGVTMSGTTLSENVTGGVGGGLRLNYQVSTVTDSLITNNTAGAGAGIHNGLYAELHLINTTISGNHGSGINAYQLFDGATNLVHSTVVGNSSYGIYAGQYTVVSLNGSVVAYNGGPSCGGALPTDLGGNFDSDGTCPGAGPIDGLDPVLADNGGALRTHALLDDSSAIDVGGDCGLTADQRGFGRDTSCDSGAFEFGGAEPVGGSVEGLNVLASSCTNLSTGSKVQIAGADGWNCRTAGLDLVEGDSVRQDVRGRPIAAAFSGSIEGVVDGEVSCRNLTTGQAVDFALDGETTWDCTERGLMFLPTDRVAWVVVGVAP